MDTPTMTEAGIDGAVEKLLAGAEQEARDDATKVMDSVATDPPERWKAKSNLITNNGQPMPERIRVWRTLSGREAFLPTVMIRQMMKKRHSNGKLVFSATPPEGVFAVPIDQSCDICAIREIQKKFYSMYDYEGHMDAFHPREWTSKQREEDRKERLEERELLRQLVTGKAPTSDAVKDRMAKARAARGKVNG